MGRVGKPGKGSGLFGLPFSCGKMGRCSGSNQDNRLSHVHGYGRMDKLQGSPAPAETMRPGVLDLQSGAAQRTRWGVIDGRWTGASGSPILLQAEEWLSKNSREHPP